MRILRQSTSVAISFGPANDPTDGITAVTGLATQMDNASTGIKISKNGASKAARHATVTATTHDSNGDYIVTLDATDTNSKGHIRMFFEDKTVAVPFWDDFIVISQADWDAIFG